VDILWRTLQAKLLEDLVGATGESQSIREVLQSAFGVAGVGDWEHYAKDDPRFNRPSEGYNLRGDPSKGDRVLG
jgi:GDPmannose 4,6-dehydratase